MNINVPQSEMITKLIQSITIGLSRLSTQDKMLQQRIKELNGVLHQSIDGGILLHLVSEAKEIAASYPLKEHKDDPYVRKLPELFHHLVEEIDFQMKMQELSSPSQRLALKVERFRKLARAI